MNRHSKYLWIFIFAALFAGRVLAADKLVLEPRPQIVNWLAGTGSIAKITVEVDSAKRTPQAEALFQAFAKQMPVGQLPNEGYLLQVQPDGVLLLAKDKHGEIYGRQTLQQLRNPDGTNPCVMIADWPKQSWRGLHVLDSGPGTLPQIKTLINTVLVKNHCNVLVYEIDYNYVFKTHPEIKADETGAWTQEQVRDLVQTCRDNGIKVIPEINCLGHQSWLFPPGALLRAHPDLEEPPDGALPETTLSGKNFYCRSWCPLNPKVNPIMFDLFGELLDAFQTDMFHVGMDEVMVIASQDCPRCKGKSPAELFAKQAVAFHKFFAARHVTMLMWADRLLNSQVMGYGKYASSANGTEGAIDSIPKDVILCDWHYDASPNFPSAAYLTGKGYRIWPTVYKNLEPSRKFMEVAQQLKSPLVMGSLSSIWLQAARFLEVLQPDPSKPAPDNGLKEIANTAVKDLQLMWNPAE